MKNKKEIITIIILIVLFVIMCFFYFKEDNNTNLKESIKTQTENTQNSDVQENTTTIKTTTEVESALTEEIELHATYYLEEIYVEEDEEIEEGENILKYTNGTYLVAPYKCVINSINIPEIYGQCTNEHYIQISSINILSVQINVDETEINNLSIGQEAQILISAFDNKTIKGNITKISNTASNGKFTVTIEFENDGEIKLGMTANIEI